MTTLFDVLLSGLFLFGLVLFFRKHRGSARIGAALIPPPWRGRTALVVLVRGAALGSVIGFFTILFAHGHPAIETAAYLLCSLPIILLAKKHLFAPNQLMLRDGLGLRLLPGAAALLGVVALAGMGLDLAGNWCVNLASLVVEFPSHWSESFDSTLIWGDRTALALGVMGNVLLAPFFEEIIFRGLVFGSLRRKFSWTASALISAGVFSALHGYGALGFLLVFWSGFVWAWMYEKSGSLLPGMLGHCMNNLIFSITQILFLRMS
jgi:membrane protease YdiL (CAAX protease family)